MSPTFPQVRPLGVAVLIAASLVGAASAQASTTTIKADCKYPLTGIQTTTIDVQVPDSIPVGLPTSPVSVTRLTVPNWNASSSLQVASGSRVVALVNAGPINGSATIPLSGAVPNVTGSAVPVTFPVVAPGQVGLDQLDLNLRALDASGAPVLLPPVTKDIDGNPVSDRDGDPATFDVYCKLDSNQSPLTFQVVGLDPVGPTKPGPIQLGQITPTSASLSWGPSTDNVGVVKYLVGVNGVQREVPATATSIVLNDLTPKTFYDVLVRAVDADGNASTPVGIEFTTPDRTGSGGYPGYRYDLSGSTTLKNLTKGTLPLKGGIVAMLTLATGALSADLTLAPTQGRLSALGFLPVTAKIAFVPSGKTTGLLRDGVLTTNSKVRIKVQEVKLFGAIPLAGGNDCQTKSLADINLKSTAAEFNPIDGGNIAGTYAISDLNGCGALNGLVSPLTAGGGNTISLNLAFKGGLEL